MQNRDFAKELTNLFIPAVKAVIELAAKHGLEPPIAETEIFFWEDAGGGRADGRTETLIEPDWRAVFEILRGDLDTVAELRAFRDAAATYYRDHGRPFRTFGAGDPEWASGRPLEVYLKQVGTLKVDETVAAEVCAEFVRDSSSPDAVVTSTYRIASFSAEREFDLADGITFRPVRRADIERFCRLESRQFSKQVALNTADWICEIRETIPKATQDPMNRHREVMEVIIGALRLSIDGRASFTLLASGIYSSYAWFGLSGGFDNYTSGLGEAIKLDGQGIDNFGRLYADIASINTDNSLTHLRLPFRRLKAAAHRADQDDRLVDLVVGMESLLVSGSKTEIGFKFKLRGAALLPESFGNVQQRVEFLKDLYDLRSTVVHGGRRKTDVAATVPKAESALKTLFLWYLKKRGQDTETLLGALDDELVKAGATWAAQN